MQPQTARVDDSIIACVSATLTQPDLRALATPPVWEALSAQDARRIVDALKQAADRHWRIDPRRSVDLAEVIVAIGEACDDTWIRALGVMAKGDAVKFIGSQQQAWDLLEEASRLFRLAGDEVGWGRTWIGRLSVAAQLSRVAEAIEQSRIARDIFVRHDETLRQLRIEMALGNAYSRLGDHRAALASYQDALATSMQLGEPVQYELCAIYNSIGVDALESGELSEALQAFNHARSLAVLHGEAVAETICRNNIAVTLSRQGHHRDALKLLAERPLHNEDSMTIDGRTHLERIECLIALNRFEEARDACLESRQNMIAIQANLVAARISLHLGTAQAYLNDFSSAQASLSEAERLFAQSNATGLVMLTRLRQSQIALFQAQPEAAAANARLCSAFFNANQQHHNLAEAQLVLAQALVKVGEINNGRAAAHFAARIARERGLPALRFGAHAVLGQIAELGGNVRRALVHHKAAVAVVRRLQHDLTLTLRPNFMLDKLQPLRSIFRLHIERGEWALAFAAVEQERSQVVLSYLSGREQLRWSQTDAHSHRLVQELTQLRESHYDLYTRVHDANTPELPSGHDQLRGRLLTLERRMREITEQLYLWATPSSHMPTLSAPNLADVRRNLKGNQLLISYYNDGQCLHALSLDGETLEHHSLRIDSDTLRKLLGQLERNISRALTNPTLSDSLRPFALHVLRQLDAALLEPVRHRMQGRTRLFIVPHGPLHFLPFNLLHDGKRHLIEQVEVVTLPSAGMLTHRSPSALRGAIALISDHAGQLTHAQAEAQALARVYDTQCYVAQDATRARLRTEPRQILHIAAHGEHRPDNPDFSYIQLADGQLFTDDLLQTNLSYELVTLSACETGRARVAANDEVLGLGWAFLYAGAGAVVSSLWRVSDSDTASLMEGFYDYLSGGASKAGAIQAAQQKMRCERPNLHPAMWGAFQIVGNADALSVASSG